MVPGVAWVNPLPANNNNNNSKRREFLTSLVSAGTVIATTTVTADKAAAADKLNLSDEELKKIVKDDILERKFVATGNLTPEIYKPTATFTDEIDTYGMKQWMTGTQKLFVGDQSKVSLLGDVEVSPEKVQFRIDEELVFRIPLRPRVFLSATVSKSLDMPGFVLVAQTNTLMSIHFR